MLTTTISPLRFRLLKAGLAGVFVGIALSVTPTAQSQTTNNDLPSQATASIALSLQDFFQKPVGDKGLVISERLKQAQGKQVKLVGYVVQQEVATLGQFLLTPRPVLMSQHADGEADDLPPATVYVRLAPDQRDWAIAHDRGLVEVTGTFDLGRKEEPDGRVSWFRLQLAPDAVRAMNAFEVTQYLHSLQHKH